MSRKIPPYAALRAFEATARLGNLRRAASDLSVSISAISHQIKSLEEHLGVALFERGSSGMSLTADGTFYAEEVGIALDRMASATAKVEDRHKSNSVTINMYPLLAAMWLMPKLVEFNRLEPDYEVKLITSMEPVDLQLGTADLCIFDTKTAPNEYRVDHLFDEKAFPVCSPAYADQVKDAIQTDDWSPVVLIDCHTTPGEWESWLADKPNWNPHSARRLDFASRFLALEAASDGLGIAMGRTPFVERGLDAGRLVCPFGEVETTGYGYYLIAPERAFRVPAVTAFRKWLLAMSKDVPVKSG